MYMSCAINYMDCKDCATRFSFIMTEVVYSNKVPSVHLLVYLSFHGITMQQSDV